MRSAGAWSITIVSRAPSGIDSSASRARTIYICSLMTEPGLTTGFGVVDAHGPQLAYVASGVINDAQRLELKHAITDHANIIVAGGTGGGH